MRKTDSWKIVFGVFCAVLFWLLPCKGAQAKALDEIVDYRVTVIVNADATLNLYYEIDWKVLDGVSEGPLSWVQVGLPNKSYSNLIGMSSNISSISVSNSGGTYAEIYFDREYGTDEIVPFAFQVTMDKMYSAYPDEDYAEYTFTPAWFDGIEVDKLTIRWDSENVVQWSPSCLVEDGYLVWDTYLGAGEKYTVRVQYPYDAYAFDVNKSGQQGGLDFDFESASVLGKLLSVILGIVVVFLLMGATFAPILIPAIVFVTIYKRMRGFSLPAQKQVTRTVVEYYPSCPNCGGTRGEGTELCSFCGSNMVKSKQEIKEENVAAEDKGILNFRSDGEYRYSDNPNRYVRVHVLPIVAASHSTGRRVHTTTSHRSSSHSSSSHRSSSHRSSCAHSSCACACACACAGGGRAGCTTKDFYRTDLKLSYLAKKQKNQKQKKHQKQR